MFKSSNFCHIASNNRNEVKAGVFVYKTTDDLQTVLVRGYFNKKIIDLNLHDLIIHVQENNADKTVVQKNTLCVIGKTLDDVITDVIKSDWQESIEDAITELQHTDANLQAQITTNKNAIDKEITDRTNADNALQGQITANANNIATNTGNIATLRNDVDGLGNQVQGIEAKIPGNATADNQLATKADLAEKQDKLVSGTNIKTVNGEPLLGSGNVKIDAGGAMPVGAIFTTPRTGTIQGAVEANGSPYNIADYSGAGSIGALLTAGSIAYVSKTEFQTQVANIGACDSFGWDGNAGALYAWSPTPEDAPAGNPTVYANTPSPSVGENVYYTGGAVAGTITAINNNIITVEGDAPGEFGRDSVNDVAGTPDPTFLVPKLNPRHIGKSAPVVGNGMTLGLTDGTNNTGLYYSGNSTMTYRPGVFGKPAGTSDFGSAPATAVSLGITTDPTKSGMIADLSEPTNLRVMVQLATGVTDQALETCTSVLADVAGLKDMSNVTATGKNTVVGWGMPDYSAGVAVNFSVNVIWTAPSDGILILSSNGGTTPAYCGLINETIMFTTSAGQTAGGQGGLIILNKNDTVKMTTITVATQHNTFVPLKGVN